MAKATKTATTTDARRVRVVVRMLTRALLWTVDAAERLGCRDEYDAVARALRKLDRRAASVDRRVGE